MISLRKRGNEMMKVDEGTTVQAFPFKRKLYYLLVLNFVQLAF
jgi:hypothetical protein